MMKKINLKSRTIGLAIIAAVITAITPALISQNVMAQDVVADTIASTLKADTTSTTNAVGPYAIVRKINIYYKSDDGSVTQGGTASFTAYVSKKDDKYTFSEVTVADLFKDGMSYWKPDKDTLPTVVGTYTKPPAEENVYLTIDKSKYIEESKTITRTITYYTLDINGNKTLVGKSSDSVTFNRPGYITNNGKKVYNDWSGEYTFKQVTVPEKSGYKSDVTTVPAKIVTPSDSDINIEVTYKKIPTTTEYKTIKRTINFLERKSDGTDASLGSATQKVTINREVYTDVNGKTVVVRDWNTGRLSKYTLPDKKGYTKTQITVPSVDVNANSNDSIINVHYVNNSFNGVMNIDGAWKYYKDGVWNKDFVGVARTTNGNWVFVKNGKFTTSYTGVACTTNKHWVFVRNGRFNTNFTGIAQSTTGNWVYVKNGRFTTQYNGIANVVDSSYKYYVKNGRWAKTFTGTVDGHSIVNGVVK